MLKKSRIEINAPKDVLMIHNYLDKKTCKKLIKYADSQPTQDTGIVNYEKTNTDTIVFEKDPGRITHQIKIDGVQDTIIKIFNDIYCERLAKFYNVNFEWYEQPQILKYPVGGKYGYHADADHWLPQIEKWARVQDRDYSVLLYLNEEYEGGELHLFHQDYKIKPTTGMLVAFPSHNGFLHSVLPTTSGIRYVIANWGAIVGSQRARNEVPYKSVYLGQKNI